MKQAHFVNQREASWEQYQAALKTLRARKSNKDGAEPGDFPARYRRLCNDLALARTRGYSLRLIGQLQQWVMEGHAFLYRPRASLGRDFAHFFAREFPALVRVEWRLTLLSFLLLFGPMLWLFWQIGHSPDFVYRVLSADMVELVERMYARDREDARSAESELFMFAYYIFNNIGVSLRTFGGGLVFGLGSALVLLFNGVQLGAVAAHLSFEGYHENFWSFVIGHGAFELPAIALSGAAGMRLGLSLLMPGPFKRLHALRLASKSAVKLLYGVMAMLLLAAGLEAFWSASLAPAAVKYSVGGALWLLVAFYFLRVGRGGTP